MLLFYDVVTLYSWFRKTYPPLSGYVPPPPQEDHPHHSMTVLAYLETEFTSQPSPPPDDYPADCAPSDDGISEGRFQFHVQGHGSIDREPAHISNSGGAESASQNGDSNNQTNNAMQGW